MATSTEEPPLTRLGASAVGFVEDSTVKFLSVDDDDFLCPICWRTISDAFGTRCGHSFCFRCISQHLSVKHDCPKCGLTLTQDQIFPNFLLNKVLSKATRSSSNGPSASPPPLEELQRSILTNASLSVSEVDTLLQALIDKKHQMEHDEKEIQIEVLMHFLQSSKKRRQELAQAISREIYCIDLDIDAVETQIKEMQRMKDLAYDVHEPAATVPSSNCSDGQADIICRKRSFEQMSDSSRTTMDFISSSAMSVPESVRRKTSWVQKHITDLEQVYFEYRKNVLEHLFKSTGPTPSPLGCSVPVSDVESASRDGGLALPSSTLPPRLNRAAPSLEPCLREFAENLANYTRYNRFRVMASIEPVDVFNGSNIISSIEFDKDLEYFATAGVTKKIKIFEFEDIGPKVNYPVHEMSSKNKLSCLSWNSYIKYLLVSSDYEGLVTLWDIQSAQVKVVFEEHEKRVWSVDFCKTDPTLIASGSDDGRVKIWSTNEKASTRTIEVENRANICSVKFNPTTSYHVAVGSADHRVHYYDLRQTRQPLNSFTGHRKAVSYVRFLSPDSVLSSSTDSTLKLWNVNSGECTMTYSGHNNEKNFVGLAASQDFIACGSEENCVYVYHRSLNHQLLKHPFSNMHESSPTREDEDDEDPSQFISSVCWRTGTNVLLAANSQGTIKLLELV